MPDDGEVREIHDEQANPLANFGDTFEAAPPVRLALKTDDIADDGVALVGFSPSWPDPASTRESESINYIDYFPRPLLNDLIRSRWLPIIGAGMSANAEVPATQKMPLWDDLGRVLAEEIAQYPYRGALDAISAYAQVYSRTRLIERVSEELLLEKAKPGAAHVAFCSIPFDIVCTTNLDFLLERQYERTAYCRPVIDEDQLSVTPSERSLLLLKLHGDLHHPQRLVLTEEDYDTFLNNNPLLATYVANLLITRTAVLIGYSLDDPDIRQIWQVIGARLGKLRRLAYCLSVDASAAEVARFERRGVTVINLPGKKEDYGTIYESVFRQLRR